MAAAAAAVRCMIYTVLCNVIGYALFHYDVKIAPQSGGSDHPPREGGAVGERRPRRCAALISIVLPVILAVYGAALTSGAAELWQGPPAPRGRRRRRPRRCVGVPAAAARLPLLNAIDSISAGLCRLAFGP